MTLTAIKKSPLVGDFLFINRFYIYFFEAQPSRYSGTSLPLSALSFLGLMCLHLVPANPKKGCRSHRGLTRTFIFVFPFCLLPFAFCLLISNFCVFPSNFCLLTSQQDHQNLPQLVLQSEYLLK